MRVHDTYIVENEGNYILIYISEINGEKIAFRSKEVLPMGVCKLNDVIMSTKEKCEKHEPK